MARGEDYLVPAPIDWDKYLSECDRPDRFDRFLEVARDRRLPDADYWRLLRVVWTDTEQPSRLREEWESLFMGEHPEDSDDAPPRQGTSGRRKALSACSAEERARYEGLPEVVEVYRGLGHDGGEHGISWTLDREKAEWFARRFCPERPRVAVARVEKRLIDAVFFERGEQEVVITSLGTAAEQLEIVEAA
jgi:hypothetical protein